MMETTRTREARRSALQAAHQAPRATEYTREGWTPAEPWTATPDDEEPWHVLGYSLSEVCPCGLSGRPAHLRIDHEAVTS